MSAKHPRSPPLSSPPHQTRFLESGKMRKMAEIQKSSEKGRMMWENGGKWVKMEGNRES